MSKKTKLPGNSRARNPVAHYAYKFNRNIRFKDRTRYQRTSKHKGLEPFARIFH